MLTRVAVIIPARFGSVRLPGKPLMEVAGKPIVQYVYENASQASNVEDVMVATDDERILKAVQDFGGKAVMTSADCASGSDRVAEVVARGLTDAEVIVNLQADEPELRPAQLDALVKTMSDSAVEMATLAVEMTDPDVLADRSQVKVVTDVRGDALYFSRAPIPLLRDADADQVRFLKHIGVYAYRRAFLNCLAKLSPTLLEQTEKLEQLRVLEHGHRIRVALTDFCPVGIDTPEDLERFRTRLERQIGAGGQE